MVAGGEHLLQTVLHLLLVVDMAHGDGGKADDRVHRGADIMGHIGQEGGLGAVGVLGLHQGLLEGLGLLPLLAHLGGDVLGHHHHHNISGHIVLGHHKGLAHAHLLAGRGPGPVVHRHLGVLPLEVLFQPLRIDHRAVLLQRLLQNQRFPPLKAQRSGAGGLEPHAVQQGGLAAVYRAQHVVLNQVLGQVKLEGAEGAGGDGNAVLPLLAAGQGDLSLGLQLLLLQAGDILPEDQHFTGPALLPLQADDVDMLPDGGVPVTDLILILDVGPRLPQLSGHRVPVHQRLEPPALLLVHQEGQEVGGKILILAAGGELVPLRRGTGQVAVRALLQVRQDKPGEQRTDAVDDIPHLPVLPLQPPAHPLPSDQQRQNVQHKQGDQHDLQHHSGLVGVLDHGLGHALGVGLDQQVFAVRHIEYAQVVGQAARGADKAALSGAALEYLPGAGGGLGVHNARLHQDIKELLLAPVRRLGGGDYPPVLGAQEHVRRLAKVAGGQDLLEIVLREVQPQQRAEYLALVVQRGVEHDHRLIGDSGVKEDRTAALPPHGALEIAPVLAVGGGSAGGQVDSAGVGKVKGVKVGVVFQLQQSLCADAGLVQRRAQQIGVVVHPPASVDQLAAHPQGGLPGRIHSVVETAGLYPLAVGRGVPPKQQNNRRQQKEYIQNILPRPSRLSHRERPPLQN